MTRALSRETLRGLANFLGLALCLVALYYIGLRLHELWSGGDLASVGSSVMLVVLVAALLYALADYLLALGWRYLLPERSGQLNWRELCRIYAYSSLAKYIPGNIFHLLGRQALSLAHQLPAGVVARSIAVEMVLLILAGALLSLYALGTVVLGIQPPRAALATVAVLCVFSGALYFIGRGGMGRSFAAFTLFHLVAGALFLAVIVALDASLLTAGWSALIVSAYVLSWMVGMVTPGAPAGLGVREATLLWILAGAGVDEGIVLVAALLSRVSTTLGDLAFAGFESGLEIASRQGNS